MSIREEVLGKRVEVGFEVLDGSGNLESIEFFPGTITSVLMQLGDDGRVICTHYVTFEDDERWHFDLAEEERLGNLRFIEEESNEKTALQKAIRWLKRTFPQFVASPRKKQKLGYDEDDYQQNSEQRYTNVEKEKSAGDASHQSDDEFLSVGYCEDDSIAGDVVKTRDEVLDDEGPTSCVIPAPEADEWPNDLASILRFMDRIEPDQHYFERFVDAGGECPRIRNMLLSYVKFFPDDTAVAHFSNYGTWEPPDLPTLHSMVHLVRTMIMSNMGPSGT